MLLVIVLYQTVRDLFFYCYIYDYIPYVFVVVIVKHILLVKKIYN